MKRMKTAMVILSSIAAIGIATPAWAVPDQPAGQQEKQEKSQPFHGKVKAVDVKAKTLTMTVTADQQPTEKLLYITDATKLTRKGKAIKLSDIMPGEEVHGTTRQTFDGKTEAIIVNVGPKEKEQEEVPK